MNNPRFKKQRPWIDAGAGIGTFVVGRAIGLHPLLAVAAGGAVWYFLP